MLPPEIGARPFFREPGCAKYKACTETPPDEAYYEEVPDESSGNAHAGRRSWLYTGPSFIILCLDSPVWCRPMRRKLFALLICAVVIPATAVAQMRQIPDIAKRGSIVHIQDTVVEIDGQQMRLSAGAQIRSRDNLFIVPMSLPRGALVKYTLDASDQIHRVWVLTPEEAAAPDKKQE